MFRQVVPKCPDVCSCDLYYFGTSTLAEPVYTLFGKFYVAVLWAGYPCFFKVVRKVNNTKMV